MKSVKLVKKKTRKCFVSVLSEGKILGTRKLPPVNKGLNKNQWLKAKEKFKLGIKNL